MIGDNKLQQWIDDCKQLNKKLVVLKCNDVAGRIFINALEKNNIDILLKVPSANFDSLTPEQLDLCRKANCIISANIHSNKVPIFNGNTPVLLLSDVIS